MYTRLPIRYWCADPTYAREVLEKFIHERNSRKVIMLDPFAGVGMFAREALKLGISAICLDINPLACLAARILFSNIEKDKALEVWNRVKKKVENIAEELYTEYCNICRKNIRVRYYEWINDKCIAHLECGHIVESNDIDEDIDEAPEGTFRYPNGHVFRTKGQFNTIREMYTRRNLKILTLLKKEISKLPESIEKDLLKLSLAYTALKCSKMDRRKGGLFPIPCYWKPNPFLERNPLITMEKYIKKIVDYCNKNNSNIKLSNNCIDVIRGESNICIIQHDARKLSEIIPEESIDVVCTDPPFFDEIQFLELSYVANKWIDEETPFDKEIIVNKQRGLTDEDYLKSIEDVSIELKKVLKKNSKIFLIIHEEEEERIQMLVKIFKKYYEYLGMEVKEYRKIKRIGKISSKPQNIYILSFKNR